MRILDVFPVIPSNDSPYRSRSNAIFFPQFWKAIFPRNVLFPYFSYLFFGKFCLDIIDSPAFYSAFFNSIPGIFLGSAKEKMMRINAFHVIAFVKDIKTFWDFSIMKLVRNSVCTVIHSFYHKNTVPFICLRSTIPNPAFSLSSTFKFLIETVDCYRFKFHVLEV
jgi:hypothetical protein